ncbi:hypothetical protein HK096_008842, partial [Nowakowskiella sp. JEL0078]
MCALDLSEIPDSLSNTHFHVICRNLNSSVLPNSQTFLHGLFPTEETFSRILLTSYTNTQTSILHIGYLKACVHYLSISQSQQEAPKLPLILSIQLFLPISKLPEAEYSIWYSISPIGNPAGSSEDRMSEDSQILCGMVSEALKKGMVAVVGGADWNGILVFDEDIN